jgi:hypothetical protein
VRPEVNIGRVWNLAGRITFGHIKLFHAAMKVITVAAEKVGFIIGM